LGYLKKQIRFNLQNGKMKRDKSDKPLMKTNEWKDENNTDNTEKNTANRSFSNFQKITKK